ncbi:MAG: TraB/GumN family protein [Ginsengibacter sp.]
MKVRNVKQTVVIILFALFISIGAYAQPEKDGVFYSITHAGSKNTSWLFGTYHLIKDSYLKELPAVTNAFKKSKGLITEVVIDSSELAMENSKAFLSNKKLTDFISSDFADSLDAILKADLGQSIEQLQPYKPMTVMLTLSMIYLIKDNQMLLSKYSGCPLDAYFTNESKLNGKTITPLETITQQMDILFSTISDEKQATMLKRFIRDKVRNIEQGNALLKAYFNNDLDSIYKIYTQTLTEGDDQDFLIKNRNETWMKILPTLIDEQSQFIAVGALHLAGPGGLITQLKKMGYTVKPVNLK